MFFKLIYQRFLHIAEKATLPTDSHAEKANKNLLSVIAVAIAFLAIFWGSAYVALGKPYSGAIPLSYAFISFLSIAYYLYTRRFEFFRFSQLLLIFCLPFFLMWSLGGFSNGSVVMIWAFFTPLAARMFADSAHAMRWLYAFLGFTIFSAIIDSHLANAISPMDEIAIRTFFVMNMGFGFTLIHFVINFFVKQRLQSLAALERAQNDLKNSNRQLQDNESKIRQLMLTDGLTGIANRRHLDEQLQSELHRAHRYGTTLSVIMTDLDNFKKINDTYGHLKGDEVIKIFTATLINHVRTVDFVARFGGEEFFIILPETSIAGAHTLSERIRKSLQSTEIDALSNPVTASFGVTEILKSDDPIQIIKRADLALYQAKEEGRNRVISA